MDAETRAEPDRTPSIVRGPPLAEEPVGRGHVTMGDMMDRHESVQLLAQDFVRALPNDSPRWSYEDARVEVDMHVQRGQLQRFISSSTGHSFKLIVMSAPRCSCAWTSSSKTSSSRT